MQNTLERGGSDGVWNLLFGAFVTFGKTDTNAFPFIRRNCLPSVYIRLNGSCKYLNGLLISLKTFASV